KSHTVSSTGTSCVTPPVTCSVPVYLPAGVACGACTSISTARLSFAGTSKGNALRFSPAIGSTSGISASGHMPAAPSPPVGCGAAGATQTWAADAEPAASKATSRGSDFTAEPPWLAASRNGGGFSVPDGQLRRLAAYCTVDVRRRAQTSVFIGRTGTCGDALLQGGTSTAAQ